MNDRYLLPLRILDTVDQVSAEFDVIRLYHQRNVPVEKQLYHSCEFSRQVNTLGLRSAEELIISARNVWVACYAWPTGDVLPFIFGNNGAVFAPDTFWLRHFPFIRVSSRNEFFLDIRMFRSKTEIKEPVVFIGGMRQWGHYWFDVLPGLAVFEALGSEIPRNRAVISTPLVPWQKEIVETVFPEYNLVPLLSETQLFFFRDLTFALELSVLKKYDFVRKYIGYAKRKIDCSSSGCERVYVTRSSRDRGSRVENAPEIDMLAKRNGFEIVEIERLGTPARIKLLSQAKVVLADPITPHLNFNAFAPEDSRLISLLPQELIEHPSERVLKGGAVHYFPVLNRCCFVGGRHASFGRHDAQSSFSIADLQGAIESSLAKSAYH
jgi:hypothetical protein